ncbi:hypothetical protein SEF58_06060 [Neomoorella humiferrea]|uniref:hypothetical protein n=2 Tax=Neomoorella humiferrea TaxID=676965 RepID=UPI00235581C0
MAKNIAEVMGLGYKYEFTWLIRLPVDELPEKPNEQKGDGENLLLWKRTSGNIILGYFRQGHKLAHPVGLEALIVTKSEEVLGYGHIVKSEIYELPDGTMTTVVEFSVTRLFDEEEKRVMTRIFREMYGQKQR